jgi:hypothetical protein
LTSESAPYIDKERSNAANWITAIQQAALGSNQAAPETTQQVQTQ